MIFHRLLPGLLIGAVIGAEIGGMFLCRQMIPDGRGQLYVRDKNSSAQLLMVDDEDNARFYPRMPENDSDSLELKEYESRLLGEYFNISGQNESVSESEYTDFLSGWHGALGTTVEMCIKIFSGLDCENTEDIVFAGRIDEVRGLFYIREQPIITDGGARVLSMAYDLKGEELLYYRLAPGDASVGAADARVKSKELVEDIDKFAPTANDCLFLSGDYSEEEADNTIYDADAEYYDIHYFYSERAKELESFGDNELTVWLGSIFSRLSDPENRAAIDYYYEEVKKEYSDEAVYYKTVIQRENAVFNIGLPVDIAEKEYHIFSAGDELMIVFDVQGEKSIILYYSLSRQEFTGFSL